jgi:hypothetical protein
VYYTDEAWAKLQLAVQHCANEVGWFGLVDKLEPSGNFLITDIFVLKQKVTGASTVIDGEYLNELDQQLFESGRNSNKLRYWGHSHVMMDVFPSSTDERQVQTYLEEFLDLPGDHFIRGIYNKKGQSKVDVYIKDADNDGWVYECVANTRVGPVFTGATDFIEGIKRNVETVVTVPLRSKGGRAYSSPYPDVDDEPSVVWGERPEQWWEKEERMLQTYKSDLGMTDSDAEAALLADLGMTAEDAADPFAATGK